MTKEVAHDSNTMTQTHHDQLAKQYLEEFLAPFGKVLRFALDSALNFCLMKALDKTDEGFNSG